jgi:hypothetical protein
LKFSFLLYIFIFGAIMIQWCYDNTRFFHIRTSWFSILQPFPSSILFFLHFFVLSSNIVFIDIIQIQD